MDNTFNYSDERFADIQMLRYRIDGFDELDAKRKAYVYYLAKATLAGATSPPINMEGSTS